MRKIMPILLSGLLLAVSCDKTPAPGAGDETVLQIDAAVAASPEATRSAVLGSAFGEDDTYGIFIAKHGSTTERHRHNSWNIRARYDENVWKYNYVDKTSGTLTEDDYEQVTLTVRDDDATADIYAYAPYIKGAFTSGPEAIPFAIQDDVMWAEQNATAANKDLNPAGSPSATFTFHHLCSLLAFEFRLRYEGSKYYLSNITASLADGASTTKLYTGGTFNALTGAFNSGAMTSGSSISVDAARLFPYYTEMPPIQSATTPTTAYMVLVPTDVADDELSFRFTFTGLGQTPIPFTLKKEMVKHSDGATYGFRPGYKYTFHFTLDNYLYLDGITVSTDWMDAGSDLGSEHI